MSVPKNYYGSLCTEMYEILHETAPEDELEFYLSYAQKGQKMLAAVRQRAVFDPIHGARLRHHRHGSL